MKKLWTSLLTYCVTIVMLSTPIVTAAQLPTPHHTQLQRQIDKTIKEFGHDVHLGIIIQRMTNGNVVYQSHAHHLFVPASVLKLFTAVAALSYLGPNFHFKTDVLAHTKRVQSGVLHSNVFFRFSGDPTLTRNDLNGLVASLQKLEIKKIKGNIYIDDTTFNHIGRGPGWMWDEKNYCYAAPINAIIIDKNCFYFKIKSGERPGTRAKVIVPSQFHSIRFENSLITKRHYQSSCPLHLHGLKQNRYTLTGCIPMRRRPITMEASINDMQPFTRGVIRHELKRHHIAFSGHIRFKKAPGQLQMLVSHASKPLSILIKETLKDSDNVIANAIYKKLGSVYYQKSGTWKNGAKAIRRILEKPTQINFDRTQIVDGAGLSRYNLITPMQLIKLLNFAYHNKKIRDVFIDALPIGGVDGSLEYRMQDQGLRGKIRAKTGTMNSITALAGYATTATNSVDAFAIITNGYIGPTRKHKRLENKICGLLTSKRQF